MKVCRIKETECHIFHISGHSREIDEMATWCLDQFGNDLDRWQYQYFFKSNLILTFLDDADAMLFDLNFGYIEHVPYS